MTTSLTVLPTRTDASLGQTKVDPGWAVSRLYQLLLAEWDVAADWIVELASAVGTATGANWDSLRGLVSGDTLDWREPWIEDAIANMHRWHSAIAPPTILTGLRAGLSFALDSGGGIDWYTPGSGGYPYSRTQTPLIRCHFKLTGNPATDFRLFFKDSTGNEGWGIKLLKAGGAVKGYTRTGGADTDVAVGLWVAATEITAAFRVVGTTLYVTINDGTPVACGAVPAANMRLHFLADAGGDAGKVCEVHDLLVRAKWTI